jgi:hypothetical protein
VADILLIATIIAFFVAAALLVRALSTVVTDAAADADAGDPADDTDADAAGAGADPAGAGAVTTGAGPRRTASGPELRRGRGRPR